MYPLMIFNNLIIFLIVGLILLSFGSKILKTIKFDRTLSFLELGLFSFGLGFGIFGHLLYLLGLNKIFYSWIIWILLGIIFLFGFKEFINWLLIFKRSWQKINWKILWQNKFLLVLAGLIFIWEILVFIGTVSPMVEFDSRWYHFGEAKYYLENHRISIDAFWAGTRTPSIFWTSAFPRLSEIFFAIFLSFKAEIAAKLVNLAFGIAGVLGIFALVRKKAGIWASLIGLLSIFATITFSINSSYGYIDLIIFGYASLAFLAAFLWVSEKKSSLIILAGIFVGLAASIKANGLFLIPILALIIFIENLIFKEKWPKIFWDFGIFLFFCLLFSFSWYLDNKVHTGSFFFPLGDLTHEAIEQKGILKNFFKLLPVALCFNFPILIFFLFGFLKNKIKIILFLLLSFFIFFIAWSLIPVHEPRYLLPGLFGIASVAGLGFEKVFQKSHFLKISAFVFVFFVLFINILMAFRDNKKFLPYILGQKTRHQYLTEVIARDYWSIYDYNGMIKKILGDSKAIVAGNAYHTYYIDFPAVHASLSGINFNQISSGKDLAEIVKNKGYRFIIIKRGELSSLLAHTNISNQKISGADANTEIFQNFIHVYQDSYSEIIIYKIK